MGHKPTAVICNLGELQVHGVQTTDRGIIAVIRTEFKLSSEGTNFLKEVKGSIEGVEDVTRDFDDIERRTVHIRIREGVDPEAAARRFIRTVKYRIDELPHHKQQHLVYNHERCEQEAQAVYGASRAWMSSEA